MQNRTSGFLIATMLMLVGMGPTIAQEIERLIGKNSGRPPAFSVNGPWMMEWSTRSEFPLLAKFEMRLHEAATNEFIGTVAELNGTGNGLKLFEEAGAFQIVIVATHSEWDIRIREVSGEEAAAIKRRAEGAPSILDGARHAVTRVPEDSFDSWRPEGNDTLLLFNDAGLSWRISFSPACPGLESATAISFVTASGGAIGQYDSIWLDDGTRCYFNKAIPTAVQP